MERLEGSQIAHAATGKSLAAAVHQVEHAAAQHHVQRAVRTTRSTRPTIQQHRVHQRRVSFLDENDHPDVVAGVYPAFSTSEYDRQASELTDLSNVREVYTELLQFFNEEMQVHSSMRHTVKHVFDHAGLRRQQEAVRQRVKELNSVLSNNGSAGIKTTSAARPAHACLTMML